MRLFFALWPGERVRGALARVAGALAPLAGGRAVPAANLHLTLAFLGEVAPERLEAARDAAREARAERFELVLDEVGSFRKARVAWAGTSGAPARLVAMQASLEAGLRARGFVLDERAFAPHVTLARAIVASVPRAPMPAIRWRPRDFALVLSERGAGRYQVLERWPLEGGSRA